MGRDEAERQIPVEVGEGVLKGETGPMLALNFQVNRAFGVIAKFETTQVSDAGSTRTVLAVTFLLLVAAVALASVTVWYWKNTVPDPEALASLADLSEGHKRPWWKLRRNVGSE